MRTKLRALRHRRSRSIGIEVAEMRAEVVALRQTVEQLVERSSRDRDILRVIYDDEAATRRAVQALRRTPDYDRAFAADPLVTVVIPTWRNVEALADRSIPSVLAQTYANFELIVIGDAAPAESAEVVASFGDDRLSFFNLPYRGPYPQDERGGWLCSGSIPFNDGVSRAQGQWIAPLGDDDAYRPEHLEQLLDFARERRLECVYGTAVVHEPDGRLWHLAKDPPEPFALQGAIWHSGLSFIEHETVDALFDEPNDWSVCRRMFRSSVRVGRLDAETVDYYPSRRALLAARGEL